MTEHKRDFGSFHSSNIEEIIRTDESVYKTPDYKIKLKNLKDLTHLFGTLELRQQLFYLSNEFTFLNHGAFGLSFKPSIEYTNQWREYAESQPLRFYDREIIPLLADIIRLFAKQILKCKAEELVLVENCTFAFNSIVNSINLDSKDKIVIYSTAYGVYKKILRDKFKQNINEIQVKFPIMDTNQLRSQIIEPLEYLLEHDKAIKYVFVDHIPSNQPFVMPIAELSQMCKLKKPDLVFICDAAHSLGSVRDFSLDKLNNIDLLFMNCHKWFCAPKGTGFLWKNSNFDKFSIKPAVQSHGINNGFHSEFIWTGLRDYCSYLGLYSTVDVWTECLGGLNTAIDYCTRLAELSSEHLKMKWSTDYLVHPSLCSAMVCVRLPEKFISNVLGKEWEQLSYDQAEIVQNYLYFKHKIEIPVKCIQNGLYVRLSCHVYNNLDEYKLLARVVLENC